VPDDSPGLRPGTTARQSLATGSSPGLAIAPEPSFVLSLAPDEPRLIAASLYAQQRSTRGCARV